MLIREMRDSDIADVVAIEQSATAYPWTQSQIADSLLSGHDCSVLVVDGRLCGYLVFSRVLDETSLLNVAVAADAQGRGFGRRLLEQGLIAQCDAGASSCFLEVRLSNLKAQSLYRSLGFALVGERKNYYPTRSGREHARVMRLSLPYCPPAKA